MIGLLLYIATFAFIPVSIGYFTFFFVKRERLIADMMINRNILLILAIILLSFTNKLIGIGHISSFVQVIPETFLMILMYWVAISLNSNSIKMIIYLTLFELLFVIIEYHYNINSFFPSLSKAFEESVFFYDKRPYGLSENTSVVALKLFLCILILLRFNVFSKKVNNSILFFLLIGIIITFNRSVIISLVFFFSLYAFKSYKSFRYSKLIFLFLLFVVFLFFITNLSNITFQLTSGREGIDILSGRGYIWAEFLKFINNNIFFGNNSQKYFVDYNGQIAHAHSSFLQILATHGIIISSLFMILIFRNINKSNYTYVIPILVYSLTQYGIFWGFSIQDIVLYSFLFNKSIDNETTS